MAKITMQNIAGILNEVREPFKNIIKSGINNDPDFIKEIFTCKKWSSATDYEKLLVIITFYNYCKQHQHSEIKKIGKKAKSSSEQLNMFFKLFFKSPDDSSFPTIANSRELKFFKDDIMDCSSFLDIDPNIIPADQDINKLTQLRDTPKRLLTNLSKEELDHIQNLTPFLTEKTPPEFKKKSKILEDFNIVDDVSTPEAFFKAFEYAKNHGTKEKFIKDHNDILNKKFPNTKITPLQIALEQKDVALIRSLIKEKAYLLPDKETATFYILKHPSLINDAILSTLDALFESGLTLHNGAYNEESVFHWAIKNNIKDEILTTLLQNIPEDYKQLLPNLLGQDDYDLFSLAVKHKKSTPLLETLIDLGFNPNKTNSKFIPIQIAIDFNNPEYLSEFLSLPKLDNPIKPSPLLYALKNKNIDRNIILMLIPKADLLEIDAKGNNFLHLLVPLKNINQTITDLFNAMSDDDIEKIVNGKNNAKKTPLDLADKQLKRFINNILYPNDFVAAFKQKLDQLTKAANGTSRANELITLCRKFNNDAIKASIQENKTFEKKYLSRTGELLRGQYGLTLSRKDFNLFQATVQKVFNYLNDLIKSNGTTDSISSI